MGEIRNGLIAAAWGALYKLTSDLTQYKKNCKIGPEKPQGECPITSNIQFYFFVGKFPKFLNFSDRMEKIYPVELNIFKENAFHGLQKSPLDNFPQNFYIWSAIASGACMQKIKIGHQENFRAKNKCFGQILFPVRAILRSIDFRYADFNTDSADACILVMACVDCAHVRAAKNPFEPP